MTAVIQLLIDALASPEMFSLMFLAGAWAWMAMDGKDKTRQFFFLAMGLNVVYGFVLAEVMQGANSLLPWKFDHYFYRLDVALGVPYFSVVRLAGMPLVLRIIYNIMVPMMIFWYVLSRRQRKDSPLLLAYGAELMAVPLCYALLPAAGPAYAFGANWTHPGNVPMDIVRLNGSPNCFPSLHFSTALLFVIFAKGRGWRIVAMLFLAGTGLATVTTGEHYIIDLAGGIVFACFAAAVARRDKAAAILYLAIIGVWIVSIRFGGSILVRYPYLLQSLAGISCLMGVRAVHKSWADTPSEPRVSSAEGATPPVNAVLEV
jgi:hypothetical protein